MSKVILKVENLSFSYDRKIILKDVTFSINEGDYLGIIGENGGGKTTLIRLVLGLLKPKTGRITLCGKPLRKFENWGWIGYIPQKATSFDQTFPASVEEIVGLGVCSRKRFPRFLKQLDKKEIIKALKRVGMYDFRRRKIGELSGGQQQRVFIAQALASEPKLLILDEPTTGVDLKTQGEFYEMLGKLNKEGMTIIMVSHDISYITKYVGKVAYVNQKLVFHGTHKEFCSSHVVDEMLGHEKHIICQDPTLLKDA